MYPTFRTPGRWRSSPYGVCGCAVLLGLLAWCFWASPAQAQTKEVRRVLIISGLSASSPAYALVDREILDVLANSPYHLEMYHEYLDTTLFTDPANLVEREEFLRQRYGSREPDLIITIGITALRFRSETRGRLLPSTPTVFCAVDDWSVKQLHLDIENGFTGSLRHHDIAATLDLALKLRPDTNRLFVVAGSGAGDRLFTILFKELLRDYHSTLDVQYLTELPMPDLLARVKELPPHSVIYYISILRDGAGTAFLDVKEALPAVAAAANAPIFVGSDADVGAGAVGGYIAPLAGQGAIAGFQAARILSGANPRDIPIQRTPNVYIFDWRELRRWSMRESDLPAGSSVLFRPMPFWRQYNWAIWDGVLLLALLSLGGVLYLERRRRERAERVLAREHDFESLIAGISSALADAPLMQIGAEIQNSLAQIGGALNAERLGLFAFDDQRMHLRLRYSTGPEQAAAAPERLDQAMFPSLFIRAAQSEAFVVTSAKEDHGLLRAMRADAAAFLPLRVESNLVGILSIAVSRNKAGTLKEFLPQLKAASQVYANAMARALAQEALLESEKRFRVMADAAPAFIWMSDRNGKFTYVNRQILEFTGAHAENLDGDGWSGYIHPEDLPAVLDARAASARRGDAFIGEYRARRRDGVYRWVFDVGNPRFDSEGGFVGLIGSAVDVTDQKLAREALEKLGGQLIAVQEKERSLIARELHDDICQRLAMVSHRIERLSKGAGTGQTAMLDQLQQVWQQVSALTGDVQALSHKLHPSILDNLGLVTAVKSFCREISEQTGIAVEYTHKNIPDSLPREVSLSVFRVVQEALHNAAKYSGGKQFEVYLRGVAGGLELEVIDHGAGFDVAKLKNEGLGLVSMAERIHLLSGNISIESRPNAGTRIRARVPVNSQAKAAGAR